MVNAAGGPLRFYLRIRFNPIIMKIEDSIVTVLSFFLFKGDRVTWTKKRVLAYKLWELGADPREISTQIHAPVRVVRIWSEIWDSYYIAFSIKDKK